MAAYLNHGMNLQVTELLNDNGIRFENKYPMKNFWMLHFCSTPKTKLVMRDSGNPDGHFV